MLRLLLTPSRPQTATAIAASQPRSSPSCPPTSNSPPARCSESWDSSSAWNCRRRATLRRHPRALPVHRAHPAPIRAVPSHLPNCDSVGISTLLGSIITRNRAFPLRFLTPPLFLVGSANYFLPKTAHNLNLYISELEQQYIPNVYEQQKRLSSFLHDSLVSATRAVKSSETTARQWTAEGRQKLQETSGLSLQQASKPSSEEDRKA